MSRYVMFAILTIAVLGLISVQAIPPPAHGGYQAGWGMNPTNWDAVSGSFYAWGLYDPLHGGVNNWIVDWTDPNNPVYIEYAPITLELWIEMYSIQTYQYTSYQWHRLGNQEEEICFQITGTVQSNSAQNVCLRQVQEALDHLWFIEDIFGHGTPGTLPPGYPYASADLPIVWTVGWGEGLVIDENQVYEASAVPDPDLCVEITQPCDHWFEFEGCFTIPYHQPDGYYTLEMAACITPEM